MPIIDDPGDVIIQADAQRDGVGRVIIAAGTHQHVLNADGTGTGAFSATSSVASICYDVTSATYGAKGDGVTDDTAHIQSAIDACTAAGGGIVWLPKGTYAIATQLTMKANVILQGAGRGVAILKFSDSSSLVMFTGAGTPLGSSTTPSSPVTTGSRTVAVTSGTGFTVGDWVSFVDGVNFRGWVARVIAVNGTTITFEEKSPNDFPTTTTVQRFTPLPNIGLKDLTVTTPTGNCLDLTTRKNGVWSMTNVTNGFVDNCEFLGIASDTAGESLRFYSSRNIAITRNYFDRNGDADPFPSQNTRCIENRNCTGVVVSGNQFNRSGGSATISHTGCCHVNISNNNVGGNSNWTGRNIWTVATTGSPTGGTFTITATPNGGSPVTTGAIAFNATAATLVAALNAVLPAGSQVKGSLGPLPTGIAVAWIGTKDGLPGTLALGVNSLTGGSSPAPTFTQTNDGTNALAEDNGGRGIKFIGGCKYFTCANNTVHDSGFDGIRSDGCNQGTITGNTIFGAHDVSIYVGSSDVAGGSDIVVIGNVIDWPSNATGSGGHGIYVDTSTPRVSVVGNKISNVGTNGTAGVYCASTDGIIADNMINIGCPYGVQLNAGATRCLVHGNNVRGATAQTVDSSLSSGGNFIYGNIGNTSYNVKTTATADSLDMVTGTTASPGKNAVL